MSRTLHVAALLTVVTLSTSSALAQQGPRPEQHVRYRQSVMTLQNRYLNQILPMAQGKQPYDAKLVVRNVEYLDTLSKMPWEYFVPETKGLKSRASGAVFGEPAKFKQAQDAYMGEMAKLAQIVRKGDEAAIKAQVVSVDRSCDNCHDTFRERSSN